MLEFPKKNSGKCVTNLGIPVASLGSVGSVGSVENLGIPVASVASPVACLCGVQQVMVMPDHSPRLPFHWASLGGE